MPVIEINEKNKMQYGGKCVVLQSHIHDKQEVQPGDIVIKNGMDYFEAKKCRLVRDYDPALDDPKEDPVPDAIADSQDVIASETKQSVVINEPKKLGPKRKSKKE